MPKLFRKIKNALPVRKPKGGGENDIHNKALLTKTGQSAENTALNTHQPALRSVTNVGQPAANYLKIVPLKSSSNASNTASNKIHLNPADYTDEVLGTEILPPAIKSQLKSHQKDTGVYLAENGYKPIKCIGVGANGVVWKCEYTTDNNKEIVVKVTCDSRMFGLIKVKASKEEIANAKVLQEIINENENEASKHLVISGHINNDSNQKRALFTSELADKGDLEHYQSNEQGYRRFIEILETGVNVLEGLKILHDAGYSHNDVKPDNLLAITEKSDIAAKQAEKSADQERVVVKLADFGCITKIKSKLHQKWFANRYFYPPDMQNIQQKAVEKRDVYSLGALLLYLLIGCSKSQAKSWAKKLEKSKKLYTFCDEVPGQNLFIRYGAFSDPKKTEKFIEFLKVIQQMVASSYSNRLGVDEALQQMKIVSHIMA